MSAAPSHLRLAGATPEAQRAAFERFILANRVNAALLQRIPDLALPQGMLVSGCLYQSVWNGLLNHDPAYGIRDYDLAYYDDSDLSYEAEDKVIKACAAAFADLDAPVEVRNQARVHLWYENHFDLPYAPLRSAAQALERYMAPCNAVAVAPLAKGAFTIHAPFGLDDVFRFLLRPNGDGSTISASSYAQKARRMKTLWPELDVQPLVRPCTAP